MRITLRVYIYSMIVVFSALIILVIMGSVKYENILIGNHTAQLNIAIEDARSSVERASVLGVPLRALLQQKDGPVEAAAKLLPSNAIVVIVDADGLIIHRAGQETMPEDVLGDIIPGKIASKEQSWSERDGGYLVAGSTVLNAFGQVDGVIVALQSDADIVARDRDMLRQMLLFMGLALVPTAVIAGVAIVFSLRPLNRSIRDMHAVVHGASCSASFTDNDKAGTRPSSFGWFGPLFGNLEEQHRNALKTLDEIETSAMADHAARRASHGG